MSALGKQLGTLRDAVSDVQDVANAPMIALWDAQLQRVMDINLAKELRCLASVSGHQSAQMKAEAGSLQALGPATFLGR